MNETEAKDWSKDKKNQQAVIDACMKKYEPTRARIAIFMAGIPGAGKTEFVRGLQNSSMKNTVIIEHDQLVEYIDTYTPERYYDFRKAGSNLVGALFTHCLKNELPFVFDGTLSHDRASHNIKKTLQHGYSVIVIYIHQDIKSAWKLTQDRELVKKRSIERKGFLRTAQQINDTLAGIFDDHRTNEKFAFWVIKKNGAPGMEDSEVMFYEGLDGKGDIKDIEKILRQQYNIEEIN